MGKGQNMRLSFSYSFDSLHGSPLRDMSVKKSYNVRALPFIDTTMKHLTKLKLLSEDSPKTNFSAGCDSYDQSDNLFELKWRPNYSNKDRDPKSIYTKDLLCWAFQVARGMEYLSQKKAGYTTDKGRKLQKKIRT